MRDCTRILLASIGTSLALALVACGTVSVQEGDGSTPRPTATPPSQATFDSSVQPILDAKMCGTVGCHDIGTRSGNVPLRTKPTVANPSAGDMQSNLAALTCIGPLDSYSPPSGIVLDYFCNSSGAPAATSDHVPSKVAKFDAASCTALYAWVATGSPGPLGTCP